MGNVYICVEYSTYVNTDNDVMRDVGLWGITSRWEKVWNILAKQPLQCRLFKCCLNVRWNAGYAEIQVQTCCCILSKKLKIVLWQEANMPVQGSVSQKHLLRERFFAQLFRSFFWLNRFEKGEWRNNLFLKSNLYDCGLATFFWEIEPSWLSFSNICR